MSCILGRLLCRLGLHDVAWYYRPQYNEKSGVCWRDGCTWAVVRKRGRR